MNDLTRKIKMVASTTQKVSEAYSEFSECVSLAGEDLRGISAGLSDILTRLTELAVALEHERRSERARWDTFGLFVPVVVGCGKARLRLACNKPNDATDNPWTTLSVYESLKRSLIARDCECLHVEGEFPVDVVGRSGSVVATIMPKTLV